jgi:hypothetical protein
MSNNKITQEMEEHIRSIVKGFCMFEEDEHMSFWTRDSGDVGNEEPGAPDIQAASELITAIKKEYPDLQVVGDTCDEWTFVEVSERD